jgi:multiple sugar transport system substrate-binding protein
MNNATIVFLGALGLVLIGCPTEPSGDSADREVVSVFVNSGVEGDGLKAAAKRYEAKTGVKIRISEFPYNNLYSKALLSLSSSTSPFDVVMLDDPWFPKFVATGALEELTPYYAKRNEVGPDPDFVSTSLSLCRDPYGVGALYALPLVGNCQLFFYRKDLLDHHDLPVPLTWSQVDSASVDLMRQEKDLHGYVIRGEKGNPIVANFMPIFWAYGAKVFDGGAVAVDSPEALEALKFFLRLKKVSPPGVENLNADQVASHQLQGRVAMAINWPAWIDTFNDPAQSKVVGKMGYAPMPAATHPGASMIGNWLVAVPKNAPNKDAAFEFITWLTSKEQQRINALEVGNPPTRVSVFEDAAVVEAFPHYPVQLKALETSKPRPRTPEWMEIENTFGIYLSQALSGVISPEDALKQSKMEIARIAGASSK